MHSRRDLAASLPHRHVLCVLCDCSFLHRLFCENVRLHPALIQGCVRASALSSRLLCHSTPDKPSVKTQARPQQTSFKVRFILFSKKKKTYRPISSEGFYCRQLEVDTHGEMAWSFSIRIKFTEKGRSVTQHTLKSHGHRHPGRSATGSSHIARKETGRMKDRAIPVVPSKKGDGKKGGRRQWTSKARRPKQWQSKKR